MSDGVFTWSSTTLVTSGLAFRASSPSASTMSDTNGRSCGVAFPSKLPSGNPSITAWAVAPTAVGESAGAARSATTRAWPFSAIAAVTSSSTDATLAPLSGVPAACAPAGVAAAASSAAARLITTATATISLVPRPSVGWCDIVCASSPGAVPRP